MNLEEMLRGSPLNQQRMADDNAISLAGMLARQGAGTVRQEPSLMQEIGGAITDYAVPDRYLPSSVMEPRLDMSQLESLRGTPVDMADVPDPVPMLMDTMPMAGITAFHGSPHKFSKFDMSKIGTGEGAQAYGHGIYAAENPKVAKEYMRPEQNYQRATGHLNNRQEFVKDMMDQGRTKDDVWKMTQEKYGEFIDPSELSSDFKSIWAEPANLYKVDIPDDQIAKMLDWDKPLSEQSETIRTVFKDIVKKNNPKESNRQIDKYLNARSGQEVYELAKHQWYDRGKSDASLSKLFSKKGIPGIKYLDGGSRTGGKGTSNFVLFADDIAKILERNDQPIGDLAEELQRR